MNFEQLTYIVEVANAGSLSKAAKKLFITQSAISQSITSLEKELGIKIFTRSRNGAVPTIIGKTVIKKALETLAKMEEIKMEATADYTSMHGKLRLGTIPSPLMYLPKTLAAFRKIYPNIKLNISEASSQSIINGILANELDIGLIGLSKNGEEFHHDDIAINVVLRGEMMVAASKQSPLAYADSITLKDIQKSLLVVYEDERMWEFLDEIANKHEHANILFSTNNLDAIRNAVVENLAITIAPDYTIKSDPFVMMGKVAALNIAHFPHDYPGMAIVWAKSRNTALIEHFITKLTSDIEKLKNPLDELTI